MESSARLPTAVDVFLLPSIRQHKLPRQVDIETFIRWSTSSEASSDSVDDLRISSIHWVKQPGTPSHEYLVVTFSGVFDLSLRLERDTKSWKSLIGPKHSTVTRDTVIIANKVGDTLGARDETVARVTIQNQDIGVLHITLLLRVITDRVTAYNIWTTNCWWFVGCLWRNLVRCVNSDSMKFYFVAEGKEEAWPMNQSRGGHTWNAGNFADFQQFQHLSLLGRIRGSIGAKGEVERSSALVDNAYAKCLSGPLTLRNAIDEDSFIASLEKTLLRTEALIRTLEERIRDLAVTVRTLYERLLAWSICFGKLVGVCGVDGQSEVISEAFDAYLEVVRDELLSFCQAMETDVQKRLFLQLARLSESATSPLGLLNSLQSSKSTHYATVNRKYLPSFAPLPSTTSYITLRSQLVAELPQYIALLEKGVRYVWCDFIKLQRGFWKRVVGSWRDLWDSLRIEGERLLVGPGGVERMDSVETVARWWNRWVQVDEITASLGIVKRRKGVHMETKRIVTEAMSPFAELDAQWSRTTTTSHTTKPSDPSGSSLALRPPSPSPHPLPLRDRTPSFTSPSRLDRHFAMPAMRPPPVILSPSHSSTPSLPTTPNGDPELQKSRRALNRVLYTCQVVHPCQPPAGIFYDSLPFFDLSLGQKLDVLSEEGHPLSHRNLPLYVDDGDDCLLVVRDNGGQIGWALASFLEPVI
ncbi:hypothetical protein JAAARDRAFT_307819 [Jaapia argillacea MUCL 33604]|uniref:Uncharacterized protein n=1 Tax=Jaapia argillacea MUCL 33604 TaxID=933084 RepID=A0A067PR62_9AGAM|nr:hypothetical protein JAAARDRAFT_307819 [Jaapia argillacea MUCL 33604]